MDTSKIYHDSEGNECSIWTAVRREPDWAANRIQVGEKAIEKLTELKKMLKAIKEWDIETSLGRELDDEPFTFILPKELRKQLEAAIEEL